MLVKVINRHGDAILVNPDHIIKITPYHIQGENGIIIRFTNGEAEEMVPNKEVEKFLAETRESHEDLCKMTDAICTRIQHLEEAMAAGLRYVGKSCS